MAETAGTFQQQQRSFSTILMLAFLLLNLITACVAQSTASDNTSSNSALLQRLRVANKEHVIRRGNDKTFEESSFMREAEEALFGDRNLQMSMPPPPPSTCTTPAPFDDLSSEKVIHVILNVQTGEFFDLLLVGMLGQVLNIPNTELFIVSSNGNATMQAEMVRDAIADDATGIITVDGGAETLCRVISDTVEAGIPVVSFDFDGGNCAPGHLLTSQSDDTIARLVLTEAVAKTNGQPLRVGYVTDLNFRPLQERDFVWEEFKSMYGWEQVFSIEDGVSFPSAESLQEAIANALSEVEVDAALESVSPAVDLVYAPFDYFAQQTFMASQNTGSVFKLYSADINDADIAVISNPDAPSIWKATAGGDPSMIGAAILRMSFLQITGSLDPGTESITIPSFLFTQEFLAENDVMNLQDLRIAQPEIQLADVASACWIKNIAPEFR